MSVSWWDDDPSFLRTSSQTKQDAKVRPGDGKSSMKVSTGMFSLNPSSQHV